MAAIGFRIATDGISPVLDHLNDPELEGRVIMGIATVVGSMAQRAFDEPALRPTPWPQRRAGGSHPLLIKTGDLRQSIHVQQRGPRSAVAGSGKIYAATHQMGRDHIPARPFFPVVDDALTGHAMREVQDVVEALVGKP